MFTSFQQALYAAIEETRADIRFDETRWPDVLAEIVWPLVTTMRDVRRYMGSVYATICELQDEIELVDILALEAIRVFRPDTFHALHRAQQALTATSSPMYLGGSGDPQLKAQIDSLMKTAEGDGAREVTLALVSRIFPAAGRHVGNSSYGSDWESTWLKARRTAHRDFLRLYFERVAGEAVAPFLIAERLFAAMTDQDAFTAGLNAVDPVDLEDVIAALLAYENDYPESAVLPATVALLNITPLIPDRPRGMFDLGDAQVVVRRVVLRLLRRLHGPAAVATLVDEALPQIVTLSDQLQLIRLVGHEEGAGHKLVTEEAANAYWRSLSERINGAASTALATERDLLLLFNIVKEISSNIPTVELTPPVIRALLTSSRSDMRSQAMGSRNVTRHARLAWESLVGVVGGEDQLRSAVDAARPLADTDKTFSPAIGTCRSLPRRMAARRIR